MNLKAGEVCTYRLFYLLRLLTKFKFNQYLKVFDEALLKYVTHSGVLLS